MAKNFKHKRPANPKSNNLVFSVLHACRGSTSAQLARETGLAHSTVSKLRTRRTRYPRLETAYLLLKAVGFEIVLVEAKTNKLPHVVPTQTPMKLH